MKPMDDTEMRGRRKAILLLKIRKGLSRSGWSGQDFTEEEIELMELRFRRKLMDLGKPLRNLSIPVIPRKSIFQ
jgi:hypothetical protein